MVNFYFHGYNCMVAKRCGQMWPNLAKSGQINVAKCGQMCRAIELRLERANVYENRAKAFGTG